MKRLLFFSLMLLSVFQAFSSVDYGRGKKSNSSRWLAKSNGPANKSVVSRSGKTTDLNTYSALAYGKTINLPNAGIPNFSKDSFAGLGRMAKRSNLMFANELSITATDNTAEGAAGHLTISLPSGVNATEDITVSYTVGGTAIPTTDYTALTGTATILTGQNSVNVVVTAANDQVIELTETVTLTITGGAGAVGTYAPLVGSETGTVNILDSDNIPANKVLSIVRTAHAAEPATNGGFTIRLDPGPGYTCSEDITVNYTITGTAVNGTDYNTLSGSVVIPAGSNSAPVAVVVKDDQSIEPITETVVLTLTGGNSTSFAFTPTTTPAFRSTSLNITDDENTVANRVITLTKIADATEGGANGYIRLSLPPGITCQGNITGTCGNTGTTATLPHLPNPDYLNPGSLVIPAGQNYVDFPIIAVNDNFIENTETIVFKPTGTSVAGLNSGASILWNSTTAVNVNIFDDDNTPTNRTLTTSLGYDGTEGGAGQAGRIRINFALGATPSETVTINYTVTGTAVLGTDFNGITPSHFDGTATLSTSGGNTAIVADIVDDNLIEGTENAVVTVTSVTSPNFTYTFGPSASAQIFDNDNTPANLQLAVTKTADGAEGGTNGAFSISLPTGLTATEDITVNYTLTGTATSGADYANPGTVIIPAGQNSVPVAINVTDDQVIENAETVILTLTGGSSTSFTLTPDAANASAIVNIADNDNIAANGVLSVVRTAHAAEPATNGGFRVQLPTGVTSSEDITVSYTITGTAVNGTDYNTLSGTVIIPAGSNSALVDVVVKDDQFIEPLTETVILTLTGGTSTSFTFAPSATPALRSTSLNITDDENIPANRVLTMTKISDATEGGANGVYRVSLPPNIYCQGTINGSYSFTGSTANLPNAAIPDFFNPGAITIPPGNNYVDFQVAAVDDKIIEGTETVIVNIINSISVSGLSSGSTFSWSSTAPITINILDNDDIPANRVVSISKTADAAEPGTAGSFSVSLPTGYTAVGDITVSYTVSGTATAGTDYAALSGTAIIPSGQNSVAVQVTPTDDNIIEGAETVIATLTGATSPNFAFTASGNAALTIADDDNTVANRVVSISKTADATEPASNGAYAISLPTGITAAENITVNYTVAGTATAGTDYAALSGTATILAGQNSVAVPLLVTDDSVIEGPETVIATLTGATSTSFTFTAAGNATVTIADDDNTVANRVVSISKTADASEPANNGAYAISLPTGITAAENITVNYTVAGTATAGTDYAALSGTATILAGQNSVAVPLLVTDDSVIEGSETVIATLTGATSASFTFTASGNATVTIADDDNTVANRVVSISKTADAAEPATNGAYAISLPAGITATENITVNYTVAGTATAGADYTALSGSAVIAAGQNSVTVPLLVKDDNVYEGAETVSLTLTGGTSTSFAFTASAANAAATATIADDDKMDQVITFAALPVKVLGDPTFTLNATGGASGNPVTYVSSNPAVATVVGNVVTIVGVGNTTITASQAGNAIYHPAADVPQVLTVIFPPNTAPTLAAINNQQVCLITAPQTIALSGISAGAEASQTTTLSVSSSNPGLFASLAVTPTTAGNASLNYTLNGTAGTATITVTVTDNGGTLNGGKDTFSRTFTLTVAPLPQVSIAANPGTSVDKGQTVQLTASGASSYVWANAAGIISGQNSATLSVRPAQTTTYTVTGTSAAGCTSSATVTITVNENYVLVANNVLTPNGDGKNDFFVVKNIDMYPNNEVRIIDRAGRAIYTKKGYTNDWDGTLNGKRLDENTYYYIIDLGNGVKPIKGFITIVKQY